VKLQYLDPATGASPMPTIGAFLQLLPEGFRSAPYRSTDATVFCVADGRGHSTVGEQTFDWTLHDVFVVPSWTSVSHTARDGDAVLFSFSDRPAQKALGLWREQEMGRQESL
jgi:gentisate 1,2-dioxygenase